jgi:glycerol-3-phosphate dehydrogenase
MTPIDLERVRADRLETLGNREFDVLVIGGGILGAGVARDAAMRGLRAGLVEQYDLAFGTSSRTSRLLHGGIRYLAQGRVGLVMEASLEKRTLHRIAPHLAEPLAFLFPTYRGSGWPLWQMRIGVKIYDLLAGGRNLGPSTSMGRREALARLPGLNPQGLTGAVRYYDALTNDARLVLDTLRSAQRRGAVIANYVKCEEASRYHLGWKCRLRDAISGRTAEAYALSVVYAAGPWAGQLPPSSIRLRLTKGVHLVIDRQRLPVSDAIVMTEGRRVLFAIPWGQRVILGTTDTDYSGSLESVCAEPADVAYILEMVNQTFPSAKIDPSDVISTWAGVRPLIADNRGGPSDISRAHQIRMPEPGWLDVAGGKLTTYRLIARQTVDRVQRHLGRDLTPSHTAEEPLLEPEEARVASGLIPLEPAACLVEHYAKNEWAVHLDDVMLRRAGWHYYHRHAGEIAERVAAWMAEVFGWDAARQDAELARYRQAVG